MLCEVVERKNGGLTMEMEWISVKDRLPEPPKEE